MRVTVELSKILITSHAGPETSAMGMILDKTDPIPLYIQLADRIEKMITDGIFKVGSLLPPEAELSKQAGINRNTVRHAIDLLKQKGLVKKRKGIGTIVKRTTPLYPVRTLNRMTSFVDDFEIDNVEIEDVILGKELIRADGELAGKLSLSEGKPAIKIVRIRMADKVPLLLEIQYYSHSLFGRLMEMDIKGSMYEILTSTFNIKLDHSVQTIRAVNPSEEAAKHLGINLTTPCIFLESLAYTEDNVCIEVLQSYYCGDRYRFKVETGQYQRGIGATE